MMGLSKTTHRDCISKQLRSPRLVSSSWEEMVHPRIRSDNEDLSFPRWIIKKHQK